MLKFALLFCLFLAGQAFAEPGFYHITFPGFPEGVKTAGPSVFEIHVLEAQSKLTLDLQKDAKTFAAKIQKSNFKPHLEKIIRAQMQACRDRGAIASCEVYTATTQATAFLVGNGKTLWTSVQSPVNENQNLQIALFNVRGDLVFLSHRAGDEVDLSPGPLPDVAQLRLSREIGTPLAIAARSPKVRDDVYLLSYPIGTGPYAEKGLDEQQMAELHTRNPVADSKGDGIFISSGKILKVDSGAGDVVLSDTDTVTGSHGGPLFNSAGEVVAVDLGGELQHLDLGAIRIVERGLKSFYKTH